MGTFEGYSSACLPMFWVYMSQLLRVTIPESEMPSHHAVSPQMANGALLVNGKLRKRKNFIRLGASQVML